MAVQERNTKNTAAATLVMGQSSDGTMITKDISIGTLSTDVTTWSSQKAYNIADGLSELFNKTLTHAKRVATYDIM